LHARQGLREPAKAGIVCRPTPLKRYPLAVSALPKLRESSTATTGILYALSGAIAFSGKAIIVKLGYRYGTDAVTMLGLRMFFALPFFAAVALWMARRGGQEPLTRSDVRKVFVLGFLGYYLASFLDFLGLEYITATLERLILYLSPTLVLGIGAVFLGRAVTRLQITALLVSYVGVVLALAHDFHIGGSNILLGSSLVFASAVSYALYLIGSGELVRKVGSLRLTAYASCVASACCIIQFIAIRPFSALVLPAPVYWLSLLNAGACTVFPVYAVMSAIERVGAATSAQVGMIGPVSTIILSSVFLGESMGAAQVAGTALVMTGIFVVSRQPRS
jgi:drug/metabolite transporter (DMT)-like permease